uniref:Tetraspanin 10 n=1 Tax=Strigops habroptila TaxID=2489341 RepID=A0A672USL0_STRHB
AFLWNLLFLLLGLLALATGVWGLLAKGSLAGERFVPLGSDPMLLFVLAGLGASAVSLAGCLGALRSSPCLLRFFVGAVLDEPDLRFLVDEVQRSLRCCGLGSYRDWEANPYFNCSAPGAQACSVPASCCLDPWQNGTVANALCAAGALRLGDVVAGTVVYVGGCVAQLSAWLRGQAGAISLCQHNRPIAGCSEPHSQPTVKGGRDPRTCSQPLHARDVVAEPAKRDSVCADPHPAPPAPRRHIEPCPPASLPHSPLHPLLGGLAFELPRLPLFELGWSLPGGGGSPHHPRG